MTEEKKDALQTIPAGLEGLMTMERPAGSDEGVLGNEGMEREDILMPRLGLAQKMSPEIDSTNVGRYIEGLQFTDLFNSVTRQPYGKGPIHFIILRRDKPRWLEFNPIDQGGGIKDFNVPPGDPRTQFTTDEQGKRVKPLATMFYDFIILMLTHLNRDEPLNNVIALSMKSSGIKAAKHLNFLIQQRGDKKIFKGVYELSTGSETDKKTQGVYATYKIKNSGWLPADSPIETMAEQMFDSWKDKAVKIDTDTTIAPEDETIVDDSMAANPEAAAGPQM